MKWASYNSRYLRATDIILGDSSLQWCYSVWTGNFPSRLVIILETSLYTRNRQVSHRSVQQPPELNLYNQKMQTALSSESSKQTHTKNVVTQKTNFLSPFLFYLHTFSVYTFAGAHPHICRHRIGVCVCVYMWVWGGRVPVFSKEIVYKIV